MRRPVVFLLVPIVLPLAVACSDSSGPDTQTCTLATNSSTFGNVTIDVKYQAIGAGDGHLSSVTYVTQTGNVTEPNPTLPWEKDITLTGGVQAQISGNGTVKTGGLTVQFLADAGPGNTDQEQSKASMERIAGILAKEKATLWINHDKAQRDSLTMAPGFYE